MLLALLFSITCATAQMADVRVDNGVIFAGDEPLTVRGIAYGSYLPPSLWAYDAQVREADLRRMNRLGINLIKQWGPVSEDLLALCEKHDIWVLDAVNCNSEDLRKDPEAVITAKMKEIENTLPVRDSRPVIFGYTLGSELHDGNWRAQNPAITRYISAATETFRKLSNRPLTYGTLASTVTDVDQSALDIFGLQVYMHSRPQFRNFLNKVNQSRIPGQPLLVTEFGTASCIEPSGWGRHPLDQGYGYEMQWDEIMRAGGSGAVIFEWNDEWYKGPPGNDYNVQDPHSEEHFGLFEAGRIVKPAAAHMACVWGAIRVVAEPENLNIPQVATLYLAPEPVDEVALALDDSTFCESLAKYLPQALPDWTVRRTAELNGNLAVIVPEGVTVNIDELVGRIPVLQNGEGVIIGGVEGEPTVLAGGDSYGLLAVYDRYLELWRNDSQFRRPTITLFGGGWKYLPDSQYEIDYGPDENTDAIVISQLHLSDGWQVEEIAQAVYNGAGLFITGGWGTYTGHETAATNWKGTALEQILPVTLSDMADATGWIEGRNLEIVQPDHPVFAGIHTDFPAIFGINNEQVKPGTEVLLALSTGEPVLIAGAYGKGRVLCLMTSFTPGWGKDFENWEQTGEFYKNCLDWVMKQSE